MKFNFSNIPVIGVREARMNIFIERIFSFLLSLSLSRSSAAYISSFGILKLVIWSIRIDILQIRFPPAPPFSRFRFIAAGGHFRYCIATMASARGIIISA